MAEGKDKFHLKIKKDKCKGCGLCIHHCPVKHLKLSDELNKKGVKFAVTNKDTPCIGCGFCFSICPECCIEIYQAKESQK